MTTTAASHSAEVSDVAGRTAVVLRSAAGLEATFLPGVGMLGLSLRHRGDELLHQRKGLEAYERAGGTLAIPFLYPWANRLAEPDFELAGRRVVLDPASSPIRLEEHGLPIHGLLGASPLWRLTASSADAAGARLRGELDFAGAAELLAAFPFGHRVTIDVELAGERLTVATTVTATTDPVPLAFGFHPYLRLPGSDRADWRVTVPACRRLHLDERGIPDGGGEPFSLVREPLGRRSFDDCLVDVGEPRVFTVEDEHRTVAVELLEGYPAAQLFAPDGRAFVCFEPMTAPTNALVSGQGLGWVAAGDAFTATWALAVSSA